MPALVEATDSPFIAEALSAPAPHLQALAKQLAGDPELVLAAVDALGSLSPRIRFAASETPAHRKREISGSAVPAL